MMRFGLSRRTIDRPRRGGDGRRARPGIEAMEGRQLLSVGATPALPFPVVHADLHYTFGPGSGRAGALLAAPAGPTVTLTAAPASPVTLMQNEMFAITVAPANTTVASYVLQEKPELNRTWVTIATSLSDKFQVVQRLAGNFDFRGGIVLPGPGGATVYSGSITLQVQFPSFADITANAGVKTAVDQAWADTKAYADAHKGPVNDDGHYPMSRRHELAFYILLDTSTGKYQFTTTVVGQDVGPGQGAGINPGARPADVVAKNGQSAIYLVATFHTHTPTTYRRVGRPVGPSAADIAFENAQKLPGLVYDYTAAAGGSIPAGYNLNGAAQIYLAGPDRRPLN